MREVLEATAQAMGDQAIALGTVADQVRALKQMLARKFPDLAEELKGQMAAEQEQTLKDVYALEVSLAKVREAVARLPEEKATEAEVIEEKTERRRTRADAKLSSDRARRTVTTCK